MKLLLDQGLSIMAAAILRAQGIDALHVSELGLSTADDADIIARALSESRIVVTFDADFHAIIALSGAKLPSVIRIRIEGLKAEAQAKLLKSILDRCAKDLEAGAVATVRVDRIRLRHLPLLP